MTIEIAYAAADEALAKRLQTDLAAQDRLLNLEFGYLLVIVSQQTAHDESVRQAVSEAQQRDTRIVPLLLNSASLPTWIRSDYGLDLTRGYHVTRLVNHLKRVDIGRAKRRTNAWILVAVLVVTVVMFGVAIWGITSGQVAFPVDEYATDNAIRAEMIDEFVRPTLEGLMPRSTQDALNFPQTVEAARDRDRGFLIQTATALPRDMQATLNAISTLAVIEMTQAAEISATPTAP